MQWCCNANRFEASLMGIQFDLRTPERSIQLEGHKQIIPLLFSLCLTEIKHLHVECPEPCYHAPMMNGLRLGQRWMFKETPCLSHCMTRGNHRSCWWAFSIPSHWPAWNYYNLYHLIHLFWDLAVKCCLKFKCYFRLHQFLFIWPKVSPVV